MGLKENIERVRQQVLHERETQRQLEWQRAIEICKNLELLDQKASQLAIPYLNAIKQFACVPIFNELIQMENLVKERGGSTPADYSIEITFDYKPKNPEYTPRARGYNIDLKENIVHIAPEKSLNINTTKNITSYLLKQYQKMAGDKKVRLALKLSRLARNVRKDGALATGAWMQKKNLDDENLAKWGKMLGLSKDLEGLGKINLENYL